MNDHYRHQIQLVEANWKLKETKKHAISSEKTEVESHGIKLDRNTSFLHLQTKDIKINPK